MGYICIHWKRLWKPHFLSSLFRVLNGSDSTSKPANAICGSNGSSFLATKLLVSIAQPAEEISSTQLETNWASLVGFLGHWEMQISLNRMRISAFSTFDCTWRAADLTQLPITQPDFALFWTRNGKRPNQIEKWVKRLSVDKSSVPINKSKQQTNYARKGAASHSCSDLYPNPNRNRIWIHAPN